MTRQHADKATLLRFTVSPDGAVVHDVRHNLPGRGVYCLAEQSVLSEAMKKNQFNRAFKTQLNVPDDLPALVEQHLAKQMIAVLHFARKSGALVHGADRIRQQVEIHPPLLIHAAEASGGSRKPLQNALQPRNVLESIPETVLEMLQPETQVRHLAVIEDRMAEQFMHAYRRWARFTGNGTL